jgi:hypothetical protein
MTVPFSPLRVSVSSACRRVRRESAPAGGSLSFVASNESNQSKDALHFAVPLRWLPSATCLRRTNPDQGTPVQGTPPFGSLRIVSVTLRAAARPGAEAKRGVDRECLRSKRPHCSWGPSEPSRSAGLCRGAQRLRPLTSGGCLNAAAAGRVVSSARPAKTEHRRAVGPRPTGEGGRLSFGSFSLAKQRKGTALSGAHPDAASRQ